MSRPSLGSTAKSYCQDASPLTRVKQVAWLRLPMALVVGSEGHYAIEQRLQWRQVASNEQKSRQTAKQQKRREEIRRQFTRRHVQIG